MPSGKTRASKNARAKSSREHVKRHKKSQQQACCVSTLPSSQLIDPQRCCARCQCLLDEEQESQSAERDRQIPGFYFDSEKQRYFRITTDSPKPEQEKTTGLKYCDKCKHALSPRKSSLAKYILSRPYTPAHPLSACSDLLEHLICQAEVQTTLQLDPITNSYNVYVNEYAVCSIEPDARCQRILTLYEATPAGSKIVQFHDIVKDRHNNLSINHNMSMTKNQKVTGLLWSPHMHNQDFYLLSLLGYGNMSGEAMLFEVSGRSQSLAARFPVPGHSIWTSDWNRNPLYNNIISIGGSRVALTFDINTKRRVIRVKCDTDVFAQQFSVKSPLLFNGSRDGTVRTCDLRLVGSYRPVISLVHGMHAPITCIRMLQDENYVMSSGMDGSLKMWDIRLCKSVQDYYGHSNEITHGLPFYLDSTDSLLIAGGQDSVTRIWSVRSGNLIHTIPFPSGNSRQLCSIPALYYADEWGGPGGKPGLFYGTNDKIRFYGL